MLHLGSQRLSRIRPSRIVALAVSAVICLTVGIVSRTAYAETSFQAAAQVFKLSGENGADNVKVFWQKVSGADSYTVFRKQGGARVEVGTTSSATMDDYGLSDGQQYAYEVQAKSGSSVIATASTNDVETFTPSQTTFTQNNVVPAQQVWNNPLAKQDVVFPTTQTGSTENPSDWNQNNPETVVTGTQCPAFDQLVTYWGRRHISNWDRRESTFNWNDNDGGGLSITQRVSWDFWVQQNNTRTHFQCDTSFKVKDSKTGTDWKIENAKLSHAGRAKNAVTGDAVLYGSLSKTLGLLLVDIDPETGKVKSYFADRPLNQDIGDLALFVDDDNTAYIVAAAHSNTDTVLVKLNQNWNAPAKLVSTLFQGQKREAPGIQKINGRYFFFSSGVRGWYPSQTKYAYADSLTGPWSDLQEIGNASTNDAQFGWTRTDTGIKRTTYTIVGQHWGANRNPQSSLKNAWRAFPIAMNGSYVNIAWYPQIDFDKEYGAVPVQFGRNLSNGRFAVDSENGNVLALTDGSDSESSGYIPHSKSPYTVTVDLGASSTISEIDFTTHLNDDAYANYKYSLSVSQDGKNYSQITDGSANTFMGFVPNAYSGTATGRYVRLTVNSWDEVSDVSGWNKPLEGLQEVTVYGSNSSPAIPGAPGNVTLPSYMVTFDTRGGKAYPAKSVKSGDLLDLSGSPEWTDPAQYSFDGWSLDVAGTHPIDPKTYRVSGDVTLFAQWTSSRRYTVTFDAQGGGSVPSQEVKQGDAVTVPKDPTRAGYTFAGWSWSKSYLDKVDFNALRIWKDTTVYASWARNYTVRFDSNGGSAVPSQTVVQDGQVSVPKPPTRAGYTFAGWSWSKSYLDKVDFNALRIWHDETVYASWKVAAVPSYTVTFDSRGGSAVASQKVVRGNQVSVPKPPTRAGYTFAGWSWSKSYLDKVDFNALRIWHDETVYASWKVAAVPSYTVTFDSRGGSAVASQKVVRGNQVSVPKPPTRAGYTFAGWSWSKSYLDKVDFNALRIWHDETVYASWSKLSQFPGADNSYFNLDENSLFTRSKGIASIR